MHTAKGGYDSSLTAPQLIEEAEMKGVGGVCLTEHMYFWSRKELDGFGSNHGVALIGAIEVETDMGHILALEVAKKLGIRGTGGSDAHSDRGIGLFATVFEQEIRSESDLITELKAGLFYPVRRLLGGEIVRYDNEATLGQF